MPHLLPLCSEPTYKVCICVCVFSICRLVFFLFVSLYLCRTNFESLNVCCALFVCVCGFLCFMLSTLVQQGPGPVTRVTNWGLPVLCSICICACVSSSNPLLSTSVLLLIGHTYSPRTLCMCVLCSNLYVRCALFVSEHVCCLATLTHPPTHPPTLGGLGFRVYVV
jgi:hypothetical protein